MLAWEFSSIGESFVDSEVNNAISKMYALLTNNPSVTVALVTIANIGVLAPRYEREGIMNEI
jgi:hypothetical protein